MDEEVSGMISSTKYVHVSSLLLESLGNEILREIYFPPSLFQVVTNTSFGKKGKNNWLDLWLLGGVSLV